MEKGVSAIEPGRLLTYKDSTVRAISFTAPEAMSLPSGRPRRAPATPKQADSPRNATNTSLRLAPTARTMPISARRRTTETEMVL